MVHMCDTQMILNRENLSGWCSKHKLIIGADGDKRILAVWYFSVKLMIACAFYERQ
jgi:hypothetical protein